MVGMGHLSNIHTKSALIFWFWFMELKNAQVTSQASVCEKRNKKLIYDRCDFDLAEELISNTGYINM